MNRRICWPPTRLDPAVPSQPGTAPGCTGLRRELPTWRGALAPSPVTPCRRLFEPLDALGFHLVGYGRMTCIGYSGSLLPQAAAAAEEDVRLASVLCGNRNVDGRINKGLSELPGPRLVVAYASLVPSPTTYRRHLREATRKGARSCSPTCGRVTPRYSNWSTHVTRQVCDNAMTATSDGQSCLRPPANAPTGHRSRPTCDADRSSTAWPLSHLIRPMSSGPISWSSWATPSLRTTSVRQQSKPSCRFVTGGPWVRSWG
ncbi:aconitase family protein [Streptomyces sp. NPDC088847]|uniref:aconitase family protein n=1 Tax=Streptomyces sp. NPDC088847 TaxID=3365909 RepID=UPI00381C0771